MDQLEYYIETEPQCDFYPVDRWTPWCLLDVTTQFAIRAYVHPSTTCNPTIQLKAPLLDRDEPLQMSYYHFISLINYMDRTEGMGEIDKQGGQYVLCVECTEHGMLVSVYGCPHGYTELCLPLYLCKQLSQPGQEAYINLAQFQAKHITSHQQDDMYDA